MNAKTKEAAQAFLKAHPEKKEIFATEDGNLFWDIHHARDHGRSIKSEVTTITPAPDKTPAKKPAANENKDDK